MDDILERRFCAGRFDGEVLFEVVRAWLPTSKSTKTSRGPEEKDSEDDISPLLPECIYDFSESTSALCHKAKTFESISFSERKLL